MPDIAVFHPIIVHIVIVGGGIGILFRWLYLSGKAPWANWPAVMLIVAGALFSWLASTSGTQAHGAVERIPGAVRAVQMHEDAGNLLWRIFMILAIAEVIALIPQVRKVKKYLVMFSGLVGVWGAYQIYQTGKLGGELVYSYGGGVGIRSGDTTDVNHVVIAALYDRAMLSRSQKNAAGAAQAFEDLATRFPNDPTIRLLAIESLLQDKNDPGAALAALGKVTPDTSARLYARYQYDRSDAFAGVGQKDSARAILEALAAKYPQRQQQVKARLDKLK